MDTIKEGSAPSVQHLEVDEQQAGQRVDNFLVRVLKGVPKSHVYRLLRRGEVRVNRGRVKADYKLQAGDVVRIPPVRVAEPDEPVAAPAHLQNSLRDAILYEDDELIVINKPSGLAVHGGSGIHLGLIELLRQMRPEARFLELVHRLDRDTSGCVMVAKKRSALKRLHELLRDDGVDKRYLALVSGRWPNRRKVVSAALQKNNLQSGERMVKVAEDGKSSATEFSVLERFEGATLVEARPITGRTHQIRVHAQHAGFPLLGDDKYGRDDDNKLFRGKGLKRLFLHAAKLSVPVPGRREPLVIEAPLSADLQAVLATLRQDS